MTNFAENMGFFIFQKSIVHMENLTFIKILARPIFLIDIQYSGNKSITLTKIYFDLCEFKQFIHVSLSYSLVLNFMQCVNSNYGQFIYAKGFINITLQQIFLSNTSLGFIFQNPRFYNFSQVQ